MYICYHVKTCMYCCKQACKQIVKQLLHCMQWGSLKPVPDWTKIVFKERHIQSAMRSKINSSAHLKFIHVTAHYRFVLTFAHMPHTKVVWKLVRVQGVL